MPRPSKSSALRWDYTFLNEDLFDDGRSPVAATFACRGVPYPNAVLDVARPVVDRRRSGPWWVFQDLAATDNFLLSVLHLAVYFGSIPILSSSQLQEAPDVEVSSLRDIKVPVFEAEAYDHHLVHAVREQVRALTIDANAGRGEELLRNLSSAVGTLRDAMPGAGERNVRLGIASFPYRPWGEGPMAIRQHPVLLKTEGKEAASTSAEDGHLMEQVGPA